MRPTGIESLRGIQAALMESLAPELQSDFARNTLQTIQMLLESLAAEWDTTAADQHNDNEVLARQLSEIATALIALPERNSRLDAFVPEIESVLGRQGNGALAISLMAARGRELMSLVERILVCFEDVAEDPSYAGLLPLRKALYTYLREVAIRGWSFWDAASFRERMARERTA